MPNTYAQLKTWRKRYPDKRRASSQRYYAKHRPEPTEPSRAGRRWSHIEIMLIMSRYSPPDPVLAKQLGRSVQAIQVQRTRQRVKA